MCVCAYVCVRMCVCVCVCACVCVRMCWVCRHLPRSYRFTESFNLSIATALVLQVLFLRWPQVRGDVTADEKSQIRQVGN